MRDFDIGFSQLSGTFMITNMLFTGNLPIQTTQVHCGYYSDTSMLHASDKALSRRDLTDKEKEIPPSVVQLILGHNQGQRK